VIPLRIRFFKTIVTVLIFAGLGIVALENHAWDDWKTVKSLRGMDEDRTSDLFTIEGKRWRVKHSHSGEGLLQVYVYDSDGKWIVTAVNVSRPGEGVSEEIDRQGEFYVRVSSTVKKWKIDIEELR